MSLQQTAEKKARSFSVGFRQKIAIVFTLLIVFIMLLSVYLVTVQIKNTSLLRAEETGRLLGRMIALSMGEDIIRGHFQGIDYALNEFAKMQKIEYCLILDNFGRIISSTVPEMQGKYFSDGWSRTTLYSSNLSIRRAAHKLKPVYDTSVPIVIGGKRYGIIRVGFTIDEEYLHIRNLLFYNLSLGAILILIGVIIAYGISATLLSPLSAILYAIESMSRGDYSQKALINSGDEFGELASSFNRLSSILQNRESSSSNISKKILESNPALAKSKFSGKLLEAVILHIELSNFKFFSEQHSPTETVEVLNAFFDQASEIVAECGGIVDKYGDGFLTVIFIPTPEDKWSAPLRAGFTALSIRSSMIMFNFRQTQLGLSEVNAKCGLAAGKVIIGNLGTKGRTDFSVLGTTVNAAREASALCKKNLRYQPVADRNFAAIANDFLQLSPYSQAADDEDFEHFILSGFANLSYFKEQLDLSASSRRSTTIIKAFGLNESSEGFALLKSLIEDKNSEYQADAVRALEPLVAANSSETKDFLQQLITETEDSQIKSTAITILGLSRDSKYCETYLSQVESRDDRVRADAVEALIPLNFAGKSDFFKRKLSDPAPRVCANSLLGLWLADDQETLSCLYKLLKSDDSKMRASGAYAIYFLASSGKFRRLFPAFHTNPSFSMLPILENIFRRMKMMLESAAPSERFQALRALGKVSDSSIREAVEELLEYETEPEIFSMANSLIAEWENQEKAG